MTENFSLVEKKSKRVDEELDNFMCKVQEVKQLIDGLASKDKTIASKTLKLVDSYLGNGDNRNFTETIDENSLKVKTCKTVINQKAFDKMQNESGEQHTQTPQEFMKSCEEDAKRRSDERRMKKEASDTIKKQAIAAFNKGEFERALSLYNKAINEFRDSAHLYSSRALTCLKLKLYRRTIEDCDFVLRCFDEKSLKALLYKAKAHKALGEDEASNKYVQEAITNHPKSEDDIREYMSNETEVVN